jgi:hypothetical protein
MESNATFAASEFPLLKARSSRGLGTAIDITEQELLTDELERRQAHLTEAKADPYGQLGLART